eukprot:TRINITY_DN2581_c0_g2_i4.p1 TRINITY_DN2581_c0_g2~~TRINITY_DN2581_c0_g2_i4.p1  ORF type:complete len:139 (+),score=23.90 TRINITY_DN2581_c0_g2_i4:56-472(+)
MNLNQEVYMTEDAYEFCVHHALQTEKEEIMGLLFGSSDERRVLIWGVTTLIRSDKQSDRVEVCPEQLAKAQERADLLTRVLKRETRVVGWYHSHPHITAPPSHVDLRTQYTYQMLDPNFIGIIVSCFNPSGAPMVCSC